MIQQEEESQINEFLKRAEVKTMRKDLLKIREADSLKQRDKIIQAKPAEELKAPVKKYAPEPMQAVKKVFEHASLKEREAEKDLKKYANEAEKQQIFLLESERVKTQDEISEIENKKEPAIIFEKNKFNSAEYVRQSKLKVLGQDEQKIQDEQKYLEEQEAKSTIPSEKKSLEQRRAEIEAGRQEREKSRWAVEKEQEDLLKKMRDLDYELQMLSTQKNTLLSRIKTIDETLRNIYSGVITREETRRMGQAEDQKKMQEQTAKMQAVKKEEIRKEQWARQTGGNIPAPVKKPVINSFAKEEEQRRQFIKDINQQTHE